MQAGGGYYEIGWGASMGKHGWGDDPIFDQDPECIAWRLLTEWADAMSRREATEPIHTPGEANAAYMSENGIPPFDPDTDIVSPFEGRSRCPRTACSTQVTSQWPASAGSSGGFTMPAHPQSSSGS